MAGIQMAIVLDSMFIEYELEDVSTYYTLDVLTQSLTHCFLKLHMLDFSPT